MRVRKKGRHTFVAVYKKGNVKKLTDLHTCTPTRFFGRAEPEVSSDKFIRHFLARARVTDSSRARGARRERQRFAARVGNHGPDSGIPGCVVMSRAPTAMSCVRRA